MAESIPIARMGDDGHVHRSFLEWCLERGVFIAGVTPAKFDGKGVGMIASRDVKEGELLIKVPQSALLLVNPDSPKSAYPGPISVHGRVAEALLKQSDVDSAGSLKPWVAAMPQQAEVLSGMPQAWPESLRQLLTPRAKRLLLASVRKLDKDTSTYLETIKNTSVESKATYQTLWLLINSRCFYWDYPRLTSRTSGRQPPQKKRDRNDCMALCPFIDYFNHTAARPDDLEAEKRICDVSFSAEGFEVVAKGDHKAGDELFVSYGAHDNDFLMIEYGFCLPSNAADSIELDELLLPLLDRGQKDNLKDANMLGNYTCDATGVCYRTQVALRACLMPWRRVLRFIQGADDGERDQASVNIKLLEILKTLRDCCRQRIEAAAGLARENAYASSMLQQRWQEISNTAASVIESIQVPKNA